MPGGFAPTMHLSISDASGDSAILEYIGGKLIVHHNKLYTVMTNEPPYDQQLALDAYWKDIGGATMLPGTDRAADRFVRASYYLSQAPQTSDAVKSVAAIFSIVRNISVPMGVTKAGSPNIAPTLWRTVSDQKNHVYYFESDVEFERFLDRYVEVEVGGGTAHGEAGRGFRGILRWRDVGEILSQQRLSTFFQ